MTDLKNRDLELKEKIQETFTKNRGRYGVRRITMTLRNAGTLMNHKKVQRLMHAMGLLGKRPKEKYHSYVPLGISFEELHGAAMRLRSLAERSSEGIN